jgi:hypothetical protein
MKGCEPSTHCHRCSFYHCTAMMQNFEQVTSDLPVLSLDVMTGDMYCNRTSDFTLLVASVVQNATAHVLCVNFVSLQLGTCGTVCFELFLDLCCERSKN